MAKSYKKKRKIEEVVVDTKALSKKEQYDLEKEKRIKEKEKKDKKKNLKKKISVKKKTPTNLGTKIFAIFMLLLMIGSVIVSSLAPIFQ